MFRILASDIAKWLLSKIDLKKMDKLLKSYQ